MLSYLGTDNRITFCHTINFFDDIWSCQTFLIVFQRESFFQILNMCHPLLMVLLVKQRIQTLQHFLHITDDAGTGNDILIDLSRIHIDLQYLGMLCEFCCISEYTVTETGAYGDQKVTACYAQVRIFGTVHTQHSCIQGMGPRECAFTHQRIAYRSMYFFHELQKFLAGIRCNRTTTYKDHGLLCFPDQGCCLLQVCIRNTCSIRKDHIRNFLNILCLIGSRVLGNIHQNRTRTATLCNTECTAHHFCQISCVFDDKVMLGDRHGNTGNVYLLEAVFSKQ